MKRKIPVLLLGVVLIGLGLGLGGCQWACPPVDCSQNYQQGYQVGYEAGYAAGREVGQQEGRLQWMTEGYKTECAKWAWELAQVLKLTEDQYQHASSLCAQGGLAGGDTYTTVNLRKWLRVILISD